MSSAYVISTTHFTAGILTGPKKGLRFDSSHSTTRPLQGRVFASPEAAQRAVARIIEKKRSAKQMVSAVSYRPLW
jgi:hypothetical protein